MPPNVTATASLMCSFGVAPSTLNVIPSAMVNVEGVPAEEVARQLADGRPGRADPAAVHPGHQLAVGTGCRHHDARQQAGVDDGLDVHVFMGWRHQHRRAHGRQDHVHLTTRVHLT